MVSNHRGINFEKIWFDEEKNRLFRDFSAPGSAPSPDRGPDLTWLTTGPSLKRSPPLNNCISELRRSCGTSRSIGLIVGIHWDSSRASSALRETVRADFASIEYIFPNLSRA